MKSHGIKDFHCTIYVPCFALKLIESSVTKYFSPQRDVNIFNINLSSKITYVRSNKTKFLYTRSYVLFSI